MPVAGFERRGAERRQHDGDGERERRDESAGSASGCGEGHRRDPADGRGHHESPVVTGQSPADECRSQDEHCAAHHDRMQGDQTDLQRGAARVPRLQREVDELERRLRNGVLQHGFVRQQYPGDRHAGGELCREIGHEAGTWLHRQPPSRLVDAPLLDREPRESEERGHHQPGQNEIERRCQQAGQQARRIRSGREEVCVGPVCGRRGAHQTAAWR